MTNRRNILAAAASAAAGLSLMSFLPGARAKSAPGESFPYKLTDAQWRKKLGEDAYQVLRHEGTERPFTSPLLKENRAGRFHCKGCDLPVYPAAAKFDSGTGWPSFSYEIKGNVAYRKDNSLLFVRTEEHCVRCGGHLGHVFDDGPKPTGLRHCINGVALRFHPAKV